MVVMQRGSLRQTALFVLRAIPELTRAASIGGKANARYVRSCVETAKLNPLVDPGFCVSAIGFDMELRLTRQSLWMETGVAIGSDCRQPERPAVPRVRLHDVDQAD